MALRMGVESQAAKSAETRELETLYEFIKQRGGQVRTRELFEHFLPGSTISTDRMGILLLEGELQGRLAITDIMSVVKLIGHAD